MSSTTLFATRAPRDVFTAGPGSDWTEDKGRGLALVGSLVLPVWDARSERAWEVWVVRGRVRPRS